MKFGSILIVIVVALGVLGASSLYIVNEKEQALVLEFGKIKAVVREPGLKFKLPFINTVTRFDDRILSLETSDLEVTPLDNRRLTVNAFARYRITDPRKFYQAVRQQGQERSRLAKILNDKLRQVLGSVASEQILSDERSSLMRTIRDQAREEASELGLSVIDVRIKRADLPIENLQSTYDRMIAERNQEAADETARGREAAQITRARADREALVLVSGARRDSEIVRGQADAERNRIFAEAFGRDPEFFAFYRSLGAYERALQGKNSTMVLSPDSEFFNYLKSDGGAIKP
jgi:membrane protease subunit HflC